MNDASMFLDEWKQQNDLLAFENVKWNDRLVEIEKVKNGTYIEPIPTGIDRLNPHFNFFKGMLMLLTGYPQSGKSELVKNFASEWVLRKLGKVCMFSPESEIPILMNELDHINKLGAGMNNWFTFMEIRDQKGMPQVHQIIEEFERLAREGHNFFVIDPLNWLTSSTYGSTMYEALRLTLTYLKQFAKQTKSVVCYVEHPNNPQANRDGEYPKCSVYNVTGGAMHFKKCDGILIAHREKNLSEFGTPEMSKADATLVEVAKLKMQKYLGTPSTVQLQYNFRDGTYL